MKAITQFRFQFEKNKNNRRFYWLSWPWDLQAVSHVIWYEKAWMGLLIVYSEYSEQFPMKLFTRQKNRALEKITCNSKFVLAVCEYASWNSSPVRRITRHNMWQIDLAWPDLHPGTSSPVGGGMIGMSTNQYDLYRQETVQITAGIIVWIKF